MKEVALACRYLRNELGLSQRAAGKELGVSFVHLNNIENGHAEPSLEILARYRSRWGIDVYLLALCKFTDLRTVAKSMRPHLANLRSALEEKIEHLVARSRSDG